MNKQASLLVIRKAHSLLLCLVLFGFASHAADRAPEWARQKPDCIPSLDIFRAPEFNQEGDVSINPVDEEGIFTTVVLAYPGNNAPITLFRREKDGRQCAILDIPYAASIEFAIHEDGSLPDKAAGIFSRMWGFPDTKIIFLFDKGKGVYSPHKCSWQWFYKEGNITMTRCRVPHDYISLRRTIQDVEHTMI